MKTIIFVIALATVVLAQADLDSFWGPNSGPMGQAGGNFGQGGFGQGGNRPQGGGNRPQGGNFGQGQGGFGQGGFGQQGGNFGSGEGFGQGGFGGQGGNFGQGQGQGGRPPVPTQPPQPATTTQSARVANCIRTCPRTPEYNPVCGTNNVQYNNIGHFNCARQCGVRVEIRSRSTCNPIT